MGGELSGAYYAHFLLEDKEEVGEAWGHISGGEEARFIGSGVEVERDWGKAFIITHQGIAIIGAVFNLEWEQALEMVMGYRSSLASTMTAALGDAVVLLSASGDESRAARLLGEPGPVTNLSAGRLTHILVGEGNAYVYEPGVSPDMEKFLMEDLPRLDASIKAFRRKLRFFRQQLGWVEKEREDVDKSVSSILHRGELNMGTVETLESEIESLSQVYERLVAYGRLIRNARGMIQSDIDDIELQLSNLSIGPESGLYKLFISDSERCIKRLSMYARLISDSQEDARAAIEIVGTRASLLRSSESVHIAKRMERLQEEGISLQAAAGLIELVLVYYYTLSIWKTLAPAVFERHPVEAAFLSVLAFSLSAVVLTHTGARALLDQRISPRFVASFVAFVASSAIIFALTFIF